MRASDRARRVSRVAAILGATLASLALAACTSLPNNHPTGDAAPPDIFPGQVVTQQGQAAVRLYDVTFVIAAIVFVLVEGLLILIAIRYRRRPSDETLPKQTHGNNPLEILWTLIPAAVVTVLFVGVFITLNETEAHSPNPDVTVDITGFQWQWTFAYPQYTNKGGQPLSYTGAGKDGPVLVLPTAKTIHFNLHAQDVIHSFYVPQFFYKKDVVPGRVNTFDVIIRDPGTYGGQCAEFCGLQHNQMYFTVRAVSAADFDAWVVAEREKANATPQPGPSGGATVQVSSISITAGFDPSTLTAPPDTPLRIELVNKDPAVPHNFAIKGAGPDGKDWVGQPPANGGQTATYQAPPLKAGTYEFYCAIHPNMRGTLTVGP